MLPTRSLQARQGCKYHLSPPVSASAHPPPVPLVRSSTHCSLPPRYCMYRSARGSVQFAPKQLSLMRCQHVSEQYTTPGLIFNGARKAWSCMQWLAMRLMACAQHTPGARLRPAPRCWRALELRLLVRDFQSRAPPQARSSTVARRWTCWDAPRHACNIP